MPDDPFALFDLERRFAIDEEKLRQRYLRDSSRMHPDRFPDPLDQADAVEQMSRLTDAYRVLCDPEARARALLQLSGVEDESRKDKLPPDLLMAVMDIREEMESAIASDDRAELDRLRKWATQQRAGYLEKLGAILEGQIDAATAGKARLELNALRYMQRMLEQMPD